MACKIRITVDLSPGLIELLDINNETMFEAYCDGTKIIVTSLIDSDLEDYLGETLDFSKEDAQ